MRTRIDIVTTHRDHRGSLFEPGDEQHLSGKRNLHVVLTEPGFVRGNHRHVVGTEITVVTGPAFVRLREDGVDHDVEIPDGQTWRFTIPPGVAHGFSALTDMTITYLVDGYYNPKDELGLAWNDPAVTADWGIADPILSDVYKTVGFLKP